MKTVFKFNVFYEVGGDYQVRFVFAENGEEAVKKLEKYFNKLAKEGYMRPLYWTDPVVEIDCCI